MLSFSVLAFERKAQLADEGLWFSCLLPGKKKSMWTWGANGQSGAKKEKKKKKRHQDLFLSNGDAQA